MNKKNKILLMVSITLFTLSILSFGTYALWTSTDILTDNNTIQSGQVKMSYTESNEIGMNNALPIKDSEGKVLTNYFDFKVLSYIKTKANDNTKRKLNYNIVLEPITVNNPLSDNEMKVYLTKIVDGVEEQVVEPTTIDKLNKYILKSQEEIFSNGKKEVVTSYRLRAWIDQDVDTNKLNEKSYSYKFRVNVNNDTTSGGSNVIEPLDNSGANAPLLTSNMIPVYYDSTSDSWKKASTTKGDISNKWYNYDNKMWANAVTVGSSFKGYDIAKNKSVSISNKTIASVPPSAFISGGYNRDYAKSYTKITVNIKTAGTFGFKATVSSESGSDFLTVTVSKNSGSVTTVANEISGDNISKTYSDTAAVGDVYVITAQYTKDTVANRYNDNGVLDTFTYPANSVVSFTDSATAGGTSGQDWTASGAITGGTGVLVGSSISYNSSTSKYDLKNISVSSISSSLVGKFVCPNGSDFSCTTPYKIVTASSNITKVDEYKSKTMTRNDLINAKSGTEVPMDAINTMWVWVPRYTYTYLNTNTPQEIKIKFEKGTESTGTIKCTDNVTGKSSTSETCTDTANGGLKTGTSTYTHPAFWWDKNDNNVREENEELTGIWVGKFEVSSDTTCTISGNGAVGSGCNLQTIRPQIKPNVTSWRGAQVGTFFNGIYKMRENKNQYGFKTTDETHMMKNMEWGAVAYLSHSKYGINKKVAINSATTYTTGCGPQSNGSTSGGVTCNSYTTILGQSASTTGNVYGVYDMSGGAWEHMMSNMVWSNGQQMSGLETNHYANSAFTGILYDRDKGTSFTGTYAFPSKRYYDKYSYGTGDKEYTRGKLGDTTKEMTFTDKQGRTSNWYSDYAYFVSLNTPWVLRGGYCVNGAGTFAFHYSAGGCYSSDNISTRAVISNLN